MTLQDWLTTREIKQVFAEEMTAAGGSLADSFDDGSRLFLRAVLPEETEVRPGDRLRAGVALRATPEAIWVHPYIFRQVCSNGAIRAHATQSRRVEWEAFPARSAQEAVGTLREAIRECCADEAFECGAQEMRSATQPGIDLALTMMPFLSRLMGTGAPSELFQAVMDRFIEGHDSSRFGLMNAVTSVARDTTDPEVRWQLEEFGGGIPVAREEPAHRQRVAREAVALRA